MKTKEIFQKCDKCGRKTKFTHTRTYPFVKGYKTLCKYCYTSLRLKIERFFNE